MAQVFISYTRADKDFAQLIAESLLEAGYTVFYDADVVPGDSWDARIESELAQARAVVVLWTPESRERHWVRNEARDALRRGILCPALARRCDVPIEFDHIQAADLTTWRGEKEHAGWRQLLSALVARCSETPPLTQTIPPALHTPGNPRTEQNVKDPQASLPSAPLSRGVVMFIAISIVVVGLVTLPAMLNNRSSPDSSSGWNELDKTNPTELRSFIVNATGADRRKAEAELLRLDQKQFEVARKRRYRKRLRELSRSLSGKPPRDREPRAVGRAPNSSKSGACADGIRASGNATKNSNS